MVAQTQLHLCAACSRQRNGQGYSQGLTHYTCVRCATPVLFSNGGLPEAKICLPCAQKDNICEDCGKTVKARRNSP